MKKIKSKKPVLILLVFLLTFCNTQEQTVETREKIKPVTTPPIEMADIQFVTKQVRNNIQNKLEYESGSFIEIPENTFVDETGKVVEGEVEVKYREFHTATDIFLGGVNMYYETEEESGWFETAGMFEFDAYQDGKPVFIAEDKRVHVTMRSITEGDDYDFFKLNEEGDNWDFITETTPEIVEDNTNVSISAAPGVEDDLIEVQLPPKPLRPFKYDPNRYTFDFIFNYKYLEELAPFNNLVWQYAGKNDDENPLLEERYEDETWRDFELERIEGREGYYTLVMTSYSGVEVRAEAIPVLGGKSYDKALKNFEEYEAKVAEIKAEMRRKEQAMSNRQKIYRSMSINSTGIYNYDRLLKEKNAVRLAANFTVGDPELDEKINQVYLLLGTDRSVISYYPNTYAEFGYLPNKNNKLIALFEDGRMAYYKGGVLGKKFDKEEFLFELEIIEKDFDTSEEAYQYFAKL